MNCNFLATYFQTCCCREYVSQFLLSSYNENITKTLWCATGTRTQGRQPFVQTLYSLSYRVPWITVQNRTYSIYAVLVFVLDIRHSNCCLSFKIRRWLQFKKTFYCMVLDPILTVLLLERVLILTILILELIPV